MRSETFSVHTAEAALRVRAAQCAGTPMLLVHGGPGGTDYLFKFFAKPLQDAGYRAIGFVQRGSTGSPSDGPFTIQALIDDVEAIRRDIGAECIGLLGHSWGGFLATAYAAAYPERVERLVLVSPIGARGGWREQFNREIENRMSPQDRALFDSLREEARNAATPEEFARATIQRAGISMRYFYAADKRDMQPALSELNPEVRRILTAQLEEWYEDPVWEEGLERLDAPASVFWGIEDPLPIGIVAHYEAILPHARIMKFDACGHFPWLEVPDEFYGLLEGELKRVDERV